MLSKPAPAPPLVVQIAEQTALQAGGALEFQRIAIIVIEGYSLAELAERDAVNAELAHVLPPAFG